MKERIDSEHVTQFREMIEGLKAEMAAEKAQEELTLTEDLTETAAPAKPELTVLLQCAANNHFLTG